MRNMAVFCLPDAQWWSKRTNLRASELSVHGICNGIRNLEKSSVRRVSCVDSWRLMKVKYRHTLRLAARYVSHIAAPMSQSSKEPRLSSPASLLDYYVVGKVNGVQE